jgi:hypothetical protein
MHATGPRPCSSPPRTLDFSIKIRYLSSIPDCKIRIVLFDFLLFSGVSLS